MNKVSVCEGGVRASPVCHSMPQIWHSGAHNWGQWLVVYMMWTKPMSVAVSLMRNEGKANRDVRIVGGQGRLSLLAVSTVWASHGGLTGQTDRETQSHHPLPECHRCWATPQEKNEYQSEFMIQTSLNSLLTGLCRFILLINCIWRILN